MKDDVRALTELRAQVDSARGQLERAHSHLAAACAANGDMAEAVRAALDDIVAVGTRIDKLQQTISDQIRALGPPLRCARCGAELPTTVRRCGRCATPLAQA